MCYQFTWAACGPKGLRRYQLRIDEKPANIFVHHCGHATALYPYYIVRDADGRGPMILASNGRGFQFLADAKARAEQIASRESRASSPDADR